MSHCEPSEPHRGPIVYSGHTKSVMSVAFSPDGMSIVSGSGDTTIRMWDAHSPSPIGDPLKGPGYFIYSVSYSPLGDMIASGSIDRSICLWDTNTGKQIGDRLRGHDGPVNSVAFSPGGNLIASGSDDRTVRLWDVQRRAAVPSESSLFKGHTEWVWSVAFSPDSTHIVSGSQDTTMRVWDVERGITVFGPLKGHKNAVHSVAFSPDSSQIVSGSYDKALWLWDVRTGSVTGDPYEGHTSYVNSVAFSPNGTYIASGSKDSTVRVWDVRTGRRVDESFELHTKGVNSVAFSPCGRRIASGSEDKTAMIRSFSGGDSTVDQGSYPLLKDNAEQLERERATERIDKHMSIDEMCELLSRHGCINLASEMDPNQDSAVLVSGGGFGDIWKGKLNDGTKVAIKAWRASLIEQADYKSLKRASREIYYWSKMKHDNVHQLMGVILFKGQALGMVSEWMDDGNLHEYMRKQPQLDRYQMCTQVASGLAYMHRCDMIHGDLKALNVLVSSDGIAKLTDFGLSAMTQASLVFSDTSNPQTGSTRWVAPELLVEGAAKNKQSDSYALGMTMLEIMTGEVPYPQCQWDFQVITKVLSGTLPARPMDRLANDERGNQMWNLLMNCWDRRPSARLPAEKVVEFLALITIQDG